MKAERADSPIARTRSPITLNKGINEKSDIYQQAMEKLYEASWKFDRGKNGEFLKTLDNTEIPKELFRQIVRAGMNLKLSMNELKALMPLFQNKNNSNSNTEEEAIDGCEFILLFYRLRYEHRTKLFTETLQKRKQTENILKYKEEHKLAELDHKTDIKLLNNYTKDDLKSAKKKVLEGAVKYDRLMPGAVQLDAFDCEYLKPSVFKEQLKMTFNIALTIPELSAFIHDFNKDNSNAGDNIYCTAFLVHFFRLGFQEKKKRLHAMWDEKKRIEDEKKAKFLEEKKELEMKNALKVNSAFTEEDKINAIKKLRGAAKLYDKTTPGAMSMKSFEVKSMPPHVFKEQLRRVFNLQVTPPELGALMSIFDVNHDGTILCEEFSKVFLGMGFEERDQELRDTMEKQKRDEQRRLKKIEDKRKALEEHNSTKVSFIFTNDEMESAMNKLIEAAWRYDKNTAGAPCLDAFEAKDMPAHIFEDQLKKAFRMKLTPQELGAIMHYFDPIDSGMIQCDSFLKHFIRIGVDERQRQASLWRKHQRDLITQQEQSEMKKELLKANKLAYSNSNHSYTETDFQNAFAKLTIGAMKYSRSGPGAAGLEAFEAIDMPPHIFREQLKMVFNVQVSLPELWSLIAYFDKDKSGSINCKYFLTQFLRTGIEERERIRAGWRREEIKKREKDRQLTEKKEQEKHEKAWAEVDFDYLEIDFDNALMKFIDICYNFDPRQLGPAGLSGFECDSLTPSEFREMCKRTFGLKVTSRELGALVSYFDSNHKQVVTCPMFLNSIVQLRVQCEEFRGQKNQKSPRDALLQSLKQSYQNRIARNTSVDARPWRENAVIPTKNQYSKKIIKQVGVPPPSTPYEKYKLRVFMGKMTGRLDLSSKLVWSDHSMTTADQVDSEYQKTGSRPQSKSKQHNANTMMIEGEGTDVTLNNHSNDSNAKKLLEGFDLEADPLEESKDSFKVVDPITSTADDSMIEDIFDHNLTTNQEESSNDLMSNNDNNNNKEDSNNRKEKKLSGMYVEFRLSIIPKEVLKLTELTELWLCNNAISALPNAIGDLKTLTVLSLNNNKLTSLTPEICLLVNLKQLHISRNMIETLPNLMGQMHKLTLINASRNKFTMFPEVLTAMTQLLYLDFSYNKLTNLSLSLKQLKLLAYLNIEDHAFKDEQLINMILLKLPWLQVKGFLIKNNVDHGAQSFLITPNEEFEFKTMFSNRANSMITNKLRRRKKKNNYNL